jgi:hypothetical protein
MRNNKIIMNSELRKIVEDAVTFIIKHLSGQFQGKP